MKDDRVEIEQEEDEDPEPKIWTGSGSEADQKICMACRKHSLDCPECPLTWRST